MNLVRQNKQLDTWLPAKGRECSEWGKVEEINLCVATLCITLLDFLVGWFSITDFGLRTLPNTLATNVDTLTPKHCKLASCARRHLCVNPAQISILIYPLLCGCWKRCHHYGRKNCKRKKVVFHNGFKYLFQSCIRSECLSNLSCMNAVDSNALLNRTVEQTPAGHRINCKSTSKTPVGVWPSPLLMVICFITQQSHQNPWSRHPRHLLLRLLLPPAWGGQQRWQGWGWSYGDRTVRVMGFGIALLLLALPIKAATDLLVISLSSMRYWEHAQSRMWWPNPGSGGWFKNLSAYGGSQVTIMDKQIQKNK